MFDWYDRRGRPISIERVGELRSSDPQYYRVALSQVGDYEVSTVWLGMDHRHDTTTTQRPLIFETMIFYNGEAVDMERYSTVWQARWGHFLLKKAYAEKSRAALKQNS